jgi:hypothetical protein
MALHDEKSDKEVPCAIIHLLITDEWSFRSKTNRP